MQSQESDECALSSERRLTARQRRHVRVRAKGQRDAAAPRLNVFRSSAHIYAQVIDDHGGHTLVAASDLEAEVTRARGDERHQDRPSQGGRRADRRAREGRWVSTRSCSIAAATSITAGSRQLPRAPAKVGWTSKQIARTCVARVAGHEDGVTHGSNGERGPRRRSA